MKNIVVLVSGRGSNLRALLERQLAEGWPARIRAVVSNQPDAPALELAADHGVPALSLDHRRFATRQAFEDELAGVIDGFEPDLVVLAGFMRILGAGFVQHYQGRLLNIHPSLLPAFPGLHTHRRALEAGCKFAGATVHFVTSELDHGPIVMQAAVPVHPGDDEAALAARVLAAEHTIYPLSVRWFVEGRLRLDGGIVRQLDGHAQWLAP